jgi:hypothetical protein
MTPPVRDALRSYDRDNLVLNLRYAPEAASRVREMVRNEQACCAFLTFEMHEHPDEVRLTIRAPEDARESADALFESFVAPQIPSRSRTAGPCGTVYTVAFAGGGKLERCL